MNERRSDEVLTAFEMLLAAIEEEIDLIETVGSKAVENSDYEGAQKAIDRARLATSLRTKVSAVRQEWEAISPVQQRSPEEVSMRTERRNLGRLQRGTRTPEIEFRQPILSVLDELGGSARINVVLDRVEQLMKGTLKEVDYEKLSSNIPRWCSTARWAWNSMANEGLLKQDSPWGVWELTEAGRAALVKVR